MRYNDWQNDAYAEGNPRNAIASRYDLEPTNASAKGAIDAKFTTSSLIKNLTAMAIAGPTNQGQPTFVWSQSQFMNSVSHLGQPDEFDFPWVPYTPTLYPSP